MKKYKYAIEKLYPFPATEEQLNIMGNNGWEMTGCMQIKESGLITETYYYYFKKEVL
jgi:hypothetical protein